MGELVGYLWFNQPPEILRQWTNQLSAAQLATTLTAARDQLGTSISPEDLGRLSYDPIGLTRLPEAVSGANPGFGQGQELFRSADGRFRILFVQASRELRTYRQCNDWLSEVESLANAAIAQQTNSSSLTLGYAGRPAFVTEVANGMKHDMIFSVGGTAAIIAVLFWLAHRRMKPMLWLMVLLGLILGCTLALGGLAFGTINVVSMGFAAILLGLAVDYAVVHYQEALAHPEFTIAQVRYAIARSIFWAATTTIVAFLMLNLGGLPGLAQLGTLVALGVALSACVMIFEFLPPLFRDRDEASVSIASGEQVSEVAPLVRKIWSDWAFGLTALAAIIPLIVLCWAGPPAMDPTANALQPRNSPAFATFEKVAALLSEQQEPLWAIVRGRTDADVAVRLAKLQTALSVSVSNGVLSGFSLPIGLWPQPSNQAANRSIARALGSESNAVHAAALAAGFTENSLELADEVFRTWNRAGLSSETFWPSNSASQWILEKVTARTPTDQFALGVLNGASKGSSAAPLAQLGSELARQQVWLSGWDLLGTAIFSRVRGNLWKVLGPMVALVLVSLWMAFGRLREIALSVGVLLLSILLLLAVMRINHWSWNLLNLMAVPLILGTGVDYSIFMQSALRRHHGDLRLAYVAVGRALLLCGGTAVAGFGSLAWSSNSGMASLGRVCAVGIAGNMLLAVFLLPAWWRRGSVPNVKHSQ
jgi:predicted exporter